MQTHKEKNFICTVWIPRQMSFSCDSCFSIYKNYFKPSYSLMLMHKFNYNRNLLPTLFLLYFTENFQIYGHNTRQTNLLHVDRKKTTTGQRSIKFKGGKLWNDLPSSIRIHRGKYTFQRKLKLYLLNRIDN